MTLDKHCVATHFAKAANGIFRWFGHAERMTDFHTLHTYAMLMQDRRKKKQRQTKTTLNRQYYTCKRGLSTWHHLDWHWTWQGTEDNGGHSYVPIFAKCLSSGIDDDDDGIRTRLMFRKLLRVSTVNLLTTTNDWCHQRKTMNNDQKTTRLERI